MMNKLIRLSMAALALTTAAATDASAQGWLTIGSNDASVMQVAPGKSLTVTVKVDMSNVVPGTTLDAISPALDWNPAFLTLDSLKAAPTVHLFNIDSIRNAGTVNFDAFVNPATAVTRDIATLYFTSGPMPGGTRLAFGATDAANGGIHFPSGQLVGWMQKICVAFPGNWGDVNADAAVDIIDAQQIARSTVGATVTDSARVANNGDVNADGEVDILDAQAVARHVVALSAPARISPPQPRFVTPTTQTLTVNNETLTLPIGSTTALIATPFDADGFTIVGCQTATWSSNDAAVRVNATGFITGVRSGTATITATSGSVSAQSVITVP